MHQHLLISLRSADSLLLSCSQKKERETGATSFAFNQKSSRPHKNVLLSGASSCQFDNMTAQALECDGHSIS